MSTPPFSSVHEEVDYYDRLLYRLVMTKDEQLEGSVNTHLPNLLEVLATPHDAVRNKVVECCSHIIKRIRALPSLQLPCSMLVSKIKASSSGAFTRNFAIIFLEIGVPRLDPLMKSRLSLEILQGISELGAFSRHQTSLLHRFLDIIDHAPSQAAALAALSAECPLPSPSDMSFLSDVFLDILLVPNASKLPRPAAPNAPAPLIAPLPGLPRESLERLCSHPTRWDSQATLAKVKLEVIRLLHSPLFGPSSPSVLPHLMIASTDSETRVKEKAESLVRLLTDLRQRGVGGAVAGTSLPTPPDTAESQEALRRQQQEVAEQRQVEDSKLAGTLLRLYLGGQDCPLGPGPTGTPLYRTPVSETARVLCMDWAVREVPDALALHEALISKAILQSLTSTDASLAIKAVGARLAAFFASRCRQASFPLIGPLLFAALQKALLAFYQQLTMFRASSSNESLDRNSTAREHCYMALTSLAHRLTTSNTPELLFSDLSLLRLLLHSLTLEGSVQAIRVSEALGAMLTAFTSSTKRLGRPPQDPVLLRPLLHAAAQSPQMRARLAAMEWTSQAFPPNDLLFRTMGLHLADDSAQAVRKAAAAAMGLGAQGELPPFPSDSSEEEAAEGGGQGGGATFPPFAALVDALLLTEATQQQQSSLAFPLTRLGTIGEALALHLVWRSLLQEAAATSLDDVCTRFPDHITRVLSWIRRGALPEHTSARADRVMVYGASAAFLLCFSRLADPSRLSTFTQDFQWVQGWLCHEDRDVRSAMAGFLGRLSLCMETTQRDVALYTLASAVDVAVTRRDGRAAHGPLLGVGHMHACWLANTHTASAPAAAEDPPLPVQLVSLSSVARAIAAPTPDDVHAAGCSSLSLVGTQAPLPLLRPEVKAPATLPPDVRSVDDVVSALVADVAAANGKERRAEAAAACLGCLATRDGRLPRREELIKACVGVGSVRDPELQLAIGEALTGLAAWGVADVVAPVLEKADDHSPHIRSAASLWLLGMVSHVDRLPALLPKLVDIQPVLVKLLKDDAELTQESSGKALAAAYDASEPDPDLRASLLDSLVHSFKGPGERTALEVNAPSSQAPLPTNVDLGPSHFREICSLALDLGRPELLYTFLALPANHAAWAGRRASRFLTTSTAGQGAGRRKRRRREEELQASLEPLLPKIVPRLFRGRFEPSGPARKAMEQLWRVVAAPDPKATVKRFLPQVLEELVSSSLGSRKWRERQAAASALAEVLSGRTYDEVRPLLEKLWVGTFRILDDLKESVAMAGLDLAKSLCTLSARLCNRDETPADQVKDVVGLLLPILLQRGLLEKNKHVQALSVLTLCRVIKGAGECIKPYLADLISVLIESMSAIEPAELQYMQFHSSSMEMSEEEMEKLRYSLSRSGPLQEALDQCLKHLDSPTITELMPRLLGHLRSGVGLNTRCCAANTVVVLAARFRPEVKPHIPALLQVLAAGALAERSVTAQRHFLGALKSVAKLASEWENRRLILRLAREYRKCADEVVSRSRRLSVVSVLRELCSASGERLEEATWRPLLPLAYVGKFDQEEPVQAAWLQVWSEGCAALGKGGGNTGRALASELVQEVEATMGATSWLSRQQSCRAIEDLTSILGPALQPHAYRLATLLLFALPGRLWEGKELALQAMVAICAKAPQMMVEEEQGEAWLLDSPPEGKTFPVQLRPRERAGKDGGEEEAEAGMDVVVEETAAMEDGAVPMEGVSPPPRPPPTPTQPPQPFVEGEEPARDETAFEHFVSSEEGSGAASAVPATPTPSSAEPGTSRISIRGLVAVLVDQCRRPSRDYRRAALGCISQLALAFPHVPMLAQTQSMLREFAGLDGDEAGGGEGEDLVSKARAVDALGAVFPIMPEPGTGTEAAAAAYAQQQEALSWLLPGLLPRLTYAVWSFRLAAYQCLRRVIERLYVRPDEVSALGPSLLSSAVVESMVGACAVGLGDAKYVQVREAALGVLLALVKRPEMEARFAYLPHADQIDRLLSQARADSQPAVVMLATEVHGLFASRC